MKNLSKMVADKNQAKFYKDIRDARFDLEEGLTMCEEMQMSIWHHHKGLISRAICFLQGGYESRDNCGDDKLMIQKYGFLDNKLLRLGRMIIYAYGSDVEQAKKDFPLEEVLSKGSNILDQMLTLYERNCCFKF